MSYTIADLQQEKGFLMRIKATMGNLASTSRTLSPLATNLDQKYTTVVLLFFKMYFKTCIENKMEKSEYIPKPETRPAPWDYLFYLRRIQGALFSEQIVRFTG